ncbi:hypothetical protein ACLBSL_33715, partial [Klebsiella pneumoniae]|uniref:hypothetical protein n=1 Tax=Klebsiella pneumoniae TaxID=573 RepID=UPI003968219A
TSQQDHGYRVAPHLGIGARTLGHREGLLEQAVQALAEQARAAGKLPKDFVLPERYRNNTPQRLPAL